MGEPARKLDEGQGSGSTLSVAEDATAASTRKSKGVKDETTGFCKTLTIFDLVVYGLIFMVPIAPMSIYGNVFHTSGGMPTMAYLIGMIAMLFTALSFGIMINLFPSSGSIFTYASKGIGRGVGFVTGWLMLMQYLITPNLMYILAGVALTEYFPQIPVWAWCLIFMAFVTLVTLRGVETTIIIDRFALIAELVVLALFFIFGISYVVAHPGGATHAEFAATNFINLPKFSASAMFAAVALAALSYVGFGSVATLTEESKGGPKSVSKALIIIVLILGALFCALCFIATSVDPSGQLMASDWDNGFYKLAEIVGGNWFGVTCVVAVALSQGLFTGLAAQTSVSRILYIMGKSGALPRVLGVLNPKTNSPRRATLFVAAFSLATLFLLLPLGMDDVAECTNFGALTTYCLLNITVIAYCWVKQDKRKRPGRLLVCPIIGAVAVGAIFISLDLIPIIVGVVWTVIGIIYYLVQTKVRHVNIDLGSMQ